MADNVGLTYMKTIPEICREKGIKLTDNRKIIAQVIDNSDDHPSVEMIYERVQKIDKNIGIATVYRTVKLFKDHDIVQEHDFMDGKSRYEGNAEIHHHHLIDIETNDVIEFQDEKLELLKEEIAKKYGYELVDHRLELYGRKIKN